MARKGGKPSQWEASWLRVPARHLNMKSTRKSLIDKVQKRVQLYARLRDCSGRSGGTNCISCGRWFNFSELDGGHFISKTSSAIRFDERNINAQCRQDNRFKHGDERNYYHGMVRKYGLEVTEELEELEHITKKWSEPELQELLNYYNEKIKELE